MSTKIYDSASRAPYLYQKSASELSQPGVVSAEARQGGANSLYENNSSAALAASTLPASNTVAAAGSQSSTNAANNNTRFNDADAAAGAPRRISSFSLLPRPTTVPALRARLTNSNAAESGQNSGFHASHGSNGAAGALPSSPPPVTPDWRLKDRMKTVGVGLVMALNIGTEPPDIVKPHPCAVLQTWLDPRSVSRHLAKECIGERLEQQYAKWQMARTAKSPKYRKALDPSIEDVQLLCLALRKQARNERVLFHYNGMGVPKPTANGEIWVFDKNHTEYIPLPIIDIRRWLGKPSIVVLDCSAAGMSVKAWTTPMIDPSLTPPSTPPRNVYVSTDSNNNLNAEEDTAHWVRDTILLCPCGANENLPMHPYYPADIFTSCLTTPIPMALRWFVRRNQLSMGNLHPDAVDAIPGKANDRKTPLGELNWIFTAVTDSIAWNMLPKPLFQRLFRQDLLVASMFRNFLLADRIMQSLGCTPVSYPPLPPGTSAHPLWQAWDLACETMLFQLMQDGVLGNHVVTSLQPKNDDEDTNSPDRPDLTPHVKPVSASAVFSNVSLPFFSEQLTAFEVWLQFHSIHKMQLLAGNLKSPEQLPVVLQVLLSQVHRIRALQLLRQFLDLGPWAVNLSLSLGIFPYVMKLLQSPEYKSLLVSIWALILSFDPSCRADLLKEGAFQHFVQHLGSSSTSSDDAAKMPKEKTLAAFVLTIACNEYPAGQSECIRLNLHGICCDILKVYEQSEDDNNSMIETQIPAHLRMWICLCLAKMVQENMPAQLEAYGAGVHLRLFARMNDHDGGVRTATCYALGCLLGFTYKTGTQAPTIQDMSFVPVSTGQVPQRVASGSSSQLQPPFSGVPNVNLPWRPQHLEATAGTHEPGLARTLQPQGTGLKSSPFLGLQAPARGQPLNSQPQYTLQQLMQQNNFGGPTGFPVGSGGGLASHSGNNNAVLANFQQTQAGLISERRQPRPSLYEDRRRLDFDFQVIDVLLEATYCASTTVRYEAVVSLARAVSKYLDAFVLVAEESAASSTDVQEKIVKDTPREISKELTCRFEACWKRARELQHNDPFPAVAKAAKLVVSVVNDHLLQLRLESGEHQGDDLAVVFEDGVSDAASTFVKALSPTRNVDIFQLPLAAKQGKSTSKATDLRRVSSELVTSGSMLSKNQKSNVESVVIDDQGSKEIAIIKYKLPMSSFFAWKKEIFDVSAIEQDSNSNDLDPLSPAGASQVYRDRRNYTIRDEGRQLAQQYVSLAPKAPKPKKKGIESILEVDDEVLAETAEDEAVQKRSELEMREKSILANEGCEIVLLSFHSFENLLMSCAGSDVISLWNTDNGKKITEISNGNDKGSRLTTSAWLNDDRSSLFMVGCDDGTVRIWGDWIESTGIPCNHPPTLVSSFYAAPMAAGARGSGLVCEWQPYSSTLLASGNSKYLRCYDLQAEKQVQQLETKTDAFVTTLTTAWDMDYDGPTRDLSPNIVVSGLSDGCLKVFDIRTKDSVMDLGSQSRARRMRPSLFAEHKSWVVATAFTGYGGRYELISGTVTGDLKAWDLRVSASLRTMDVQRSTLTSFAVHPKLPIAATGSHTQFIKLLTLDGDTLQLIRYHEKMASHRIGPVSCLAFHRYKPLLAAGATDSYIGLYTTKRHHDYR